LLEYDTGNWVGDFSGKELVGIGELQPSFNSRLKSERFQ